jgi:hypothetical protein
MTFRDDVGRVLLGDGGGGDRGRDRDVRHDLAHDRVDRGVLKSQLVVSWVNVILQKLSDTHDPQGLPDTRIQQGQVLQVLVSQITESTIGVPELFLLLLKEFLATGTNVFRT